MDRLVYTALTGLKGKMQAQAAIARASPAAAAAASAGGRVGMGLPPVRRADRPRIPGPRRGRKPNRVGGRVRLKDRRRRRPPGARRMP